MGQGLWHGLTALGNGPSIAYLIAGSVIGMLVGVIPGLSTVVILSIILVFIYHIDVTGTLCLFLGAQCGSFYSASVSAILLNTPSHPESYPITLDGYPMARNGQPGRALGLSACSTFIGGLIGCAVLVGFLQIINYLPGIFHAPEYLALVTLAMVMVGTLGTNSVGKAVASAGAGLMLASVGPSINTGVLRYTFGAVGLIGGISIVALALGVFAIPQMVMVFGTGTATARQDMIGQEIGAIEEVNLTKGFGKELVGGIFETFRHWVVLIQSGLVGGLTGIIPGIGGFTGNFLAYGIAKQTSRKKALYGTGIPDGIIAPEGSSLAKEAGHIIPILGLGIPGGVAGALFIGALSIKGIHTGYGFQAAYPNVAYEIVWIIALSGLIGTVAGVLIGPQIARVTKVPGPFLVPFIFALSITGPFLTDASFFAVIEVVVFGIMGLALRRLRYPLGAFILGLVLGPTFEQNIYLTRSIYPGVSFLTARPMADVIFFVVILVVVGKWSEIRRDSKKLKASLAEEIAVIDDGPLRIEALRAQQLRLSPYPLLAPLTSAFLLGVALFFIIYGTSHYGFTTAVMPLIGGCCVAIPTAMFLPRDLQRYVHYRKAAARASEAAVTVELGNPVDMVTGAIGEEPVADLSLGLPLSEGGLAVAIDDPAITTVSPMAVVDKSWGPNGQYRRELIAFVWLATLLGICWLFGFTIGVAVFMGAYASIATRRYLKKMRQRVLFVVFSTAAIWLLTYEMFNLTHLGFSPKINF